MKTIKNACTPQPNALNINVVDQIEQLDEFINATNGREHFDKTFITEGMRKLLVEGTARLASKTNTCIFHLKQAMGGGKTHVMVAFALLARDPALRQELIPDIAHQNEFAEAKVAAFNGRNQPSNFFWGEIARQLGKDYVFNHLTSGIQAPDESAWLNLFGDNQPVVILLDEMPPYFQYYSTQQAGNGTVADIVTRGFANMLTAAQKKSNVCIVVSDLEAAYRTGGTLIQTALHDSTNELNRAAVSLTPVNLESNEIYDILRKRLFSKLPDADEVADIAARYEELIQDAVKARAIENGADTTALEIENTYPFHPSFKNIVALFKENEGFNQTRGLIELVSRLLKSVWESDEDIYLIGAQHFDLSLLEVRDKLAEISEMREVIAKDLWDQNGNSHAQEIALSCRGNHVQKLGTMILLSSLSSAVNAVKGLSESELLLYIIDPNNKPSDFKPCLNAMIKCAWYLHKNQEGKIYFDKQENILKRLESYADKAPENKIQELIENRLSDMFKPRTGEAYSKVVPLPSLDLALAEVNRNRVLLITQPDGPMPPKMINQLFEQVPNQNNILVLTGTRTCFADLNKSARQVYAVNKLQPEVKDNPEQTRELDEKKVQFSQDFGSTLLAFYDQVVFPGSASPSPLPLLRHKTLDPNYDQTQGYDGERQIIKTLSATPSKLFTDVEKNFDMLKARADRLLFGNCDERSKGELTDKMKQVCAMPWLPTGKGLDKLINLACQRGQWEDLGNNRFTNKPKPKLTEVCISERIPQDEEGYVELVLNTHNAGNTPVIHYTEEGTVSPQSPVLKDDSLRTNALRVEFLAVDPSGTHATGDPKTWHNTLKIRNRLTDQFDTRSVELFVAPRGIIRYSLDGTEPRNGTEYTPSQPVDIGKDSDVTMLVFAECEGIETKDTFKFPIIDDGSDKRFIVKEDKPAQWESPSKFKIEGAEPVYKALQMASDKGISFDKVNLILNSAENESLDLNIIKHKVSADFILSSLQSAQEFMDNTTKISFKFAAINTPTGRLLIDFGKEFGMELSISQGTLKQ